MKYLFESEEEETGTLGRKARRSADSDQEITLGTRSILGIFFGLVLICGVFFGLGYSVGRGNSARLLAETAPADTVVVPDSHIAKPSAQQTLSAVQPDTAEPAADSQPADSDAGSGTDTSTAETHPAAPTPAVLSTTAPAARAAANPAPAAQTTSAPAPAAPAPVLQRAAVVESTPTASSYMVQIAAVRVPEDANILVGALQKHGYTAVVRREPQDALLHIQLGPYVMRAEANAMRARLLADGYNAVVK